MEVLTWLDPGPDAGLGAVFIASFLAATLLPGGSELVFAGFLQLHPDQAWPALALATVGNTLGGMTTYAMARAIPHGATPPRAAWIERHGAPVLVLAWAPLVGDALCAAAGWLRLSPVACAAWMALGKLLRYALIQAATLA
ncbi:MAG TPA: DedA family protein [Ottowia sp.]|nr:DedA family protein [Ottowia sp.]